MDSQQGRHGGLPQAETETSHPSASSPRKMRRARRQAGGLSQISSRESLAPHTVTRDARDVGAHDAEIGKLTVGEQVEFTPGGVVTVPALETVAEEVEHGLS